MNMYKQFEEKLKDISRERFGKSLKALDKDEGTISAKLNNRVSFTQDEIDGICELLDISNEEIGNYFFAR